MTATSFVPGDAIAFVTDRTVAIVTGARPDRSVLAAIDASAGWDDVVAAIGSCSGGALVDRRDQRTRIATIGSAFTAVVRRGDDERRFEACSDQWVAHDVDADSVRLGRSSDVTSDVSSDPAEFAVDTGMVPAAVVVRRFGAGASEPPDPFEALFGHTIDRSIESAAIRPEDHRSTAGAPALVADDGRRVVIDRPVLLGRRPVPMADAERDARTLRLDRRGVSRRHALVCAGQWAAVVTDLGSSNGTAVTRPDGQVERVGTDRSTALLPGSVLHLGGEVSLSVESLA